MTLIIFGAVQKLKHKLNNHEQRNVELYFSDQK